LDDYDRNENKLRATKKRNEQTCTIAFDASSSSSSRSLAFCFLFFFFSLFFVSSTDDGDCPNLFTARRTLFEAANVLTLFLFLFFILFFSSYSTTEVRRLLTEVVFQIVFQCCLLVKLGQTRFDLSLISSCERVSERATH
jgi:hypothetical protein